jgi:hypothetical protein
MAPAMTPTSTLKATTKISLLRAPSVVAKVFIRDVVMPSKKENKKARLSRVVDDPAFRRVKELRRRQTKRQAAKQDAAQVAAKIQQELTQLESLSEGE